MGRISLYRCPLGLAPEVMRPLGSALKRVVDEVPVTLERRDVPIIEKITFGGELLVTEPSNREGYKGRVYWARSGDIIYSKIRVKQGSITVVRTHVASIAVSTEYPVFAVDADVARADYLPLVLRCSMFQLKLDGLSHGGSTKTRIHPDQFEALEIPLPPLSAQQSIVRHWQEAQTAAEAARREAEAVEREAAREFLHGLGLKAPEEAKRRKCFAMQ